MTIQATGITDVQFSLGRLENALGFLLRITQVQLNERVRAECGALAMPPGAMAVLQIVEANPGIRQAQLSRVLLIQESNLTNLVKKFLADGLLDRRPIAGAKRGGLWLTEAGKQAVDLHERSQAINRTYASMLSDDEYAQLIALLTRAYHASLGPI